VVVFGIMKKTETPFFIGYVEQSIGGSQDPLSPPISISRNGTLAKWRDKLQFIDLRVNDPGLKKNRAAFENMLEKAKALEIKVIITLPEYAPAFFELPPEPPPAEDARPVRRSNEKNPDKLVYFKPAYLALPSALEGNSAYHTLSIDDCLPVIEMAARHGVENIVVPVSEPGMFLDPQAETRFKKTFKLIHEAAEKNGIKLHIRNGGITISVFKKLTREFKCGLAYDAGIGHLEGDNILEVYQRFSDQIAILTLQQVLPGIDKLSQRREGMERAMKAYVKSRKEYRQSIEDNEPVYTEGCLKRFNGALKDYYEAYRNTFLNLGLFQNGDINLVPLLRELRREIAAGGEKYLLLAVVPNTRNNEFVIRNVAPDNFSGTI